MHRTRSSTSRSFENYYDAEGHRIYVNTREKAYEAIVAGVETVATSDRLASDDRVYDLQGPPHGRAPLAQRHLHPARQEVCGEVEASLL